jgi:2-desacetyl-2-hydroxyethyl bacteriochlorophyllide A dehydrogenase
MEIHDILIYESPKGLNGFLGKEEMKAIIWTKYGSPEGLQLQQVKKPVPKADEILIKIHATTVTAGDCEMRRLQLPLMLSFPIRLYAGLLRPKRIRILGQEFSGEVVQVGSEVTAYQIGDRVFGTTGFKFGAYADYICLPAQPDDAQGVLAVKSANLTYCEAAAVPTAGLEALHYMRSANVKPMTEVLIIGGGGSIGTFSIQLAKYFGAEVTAVDSTGKLKAMLSLGADHVVDYTQDDYTKSSQTFDLIIDVVGKHAIPKRLKLLKKDGLYFLAFAKPIHIPLAILTSLTSKKRLKIGSAGQTKEEMIFLKKLLETGKIKSVIDRCFSLEEVPQAHRYVESGGKFGNVCISLDSD